MAVYFVFGLSGTAPGRLRLASDASTTYAAARGAQPAASANDRAHDGCATNSAPRAARAQTTRGRSARIAAFGFLAVCSGGLASLAASPAALTVAVTVCVISVLLGVRQAAGPNVTNELASWIALAASIAGLAYAVSIANTRHHQPILACPVHLPARLGLTPRDDMRRCPHEKRAKPNVERRSRSLRSAKVAVEQSGWNPTASETVADPMPGLRPDVDADWSSCQLAHCRI
jgi:hypothetical protein